MTTDSESLIHLNALRNAFANGNVAVMVGAGFSRNAQGGDQLMMWPDLARILWQELNPTGSTAGFSTALVTQLGEQYARVFSPSALESLLKRLIPDEKVSPGALHERFVQLPWAEIFTTNYDTLIERAAEGIVERAHYTVTCREDIPQSKILGRRRIVKLHGSFPSQRPFIFTEEDYRQYPAKFAPFVNLVRQSLLENVFCLIGFSGDDPNFLHWIGWVRDMLDKHALPIYMFVGQDAPIGQRKLLEARKVTPVVLPLPDGCDPTDYAARYTALFTILSTPLKSADTDWGGGLSELSALSTYTTDVNEKYQRLLKVFPQLLELRETYPGWLVAPAAVRGRFAQTLRWLPTPLDTLKIYERLESESPRVGVVLLAQYCWQQNVLLQCFDDRLAAIGLRLLGLTKDVLKTGLDGELDVLSRLNVKTPREFKVQWRELLLGLLRWTREELRSDQFSELKTLIDGDLFGDRILGDIVKHESILLALYEGQRDVARQLLLGWDVRSLDEFMHVRKGALLAEVGEIEPGLKACLEGLQRLRSNQRAHSGNARYLSEEAWACLVISNIQKSKNPFQFTSDGADAEEARLSEKIGRRLVDLAAKGFDVRRERDKIASSLDAEAQPPSSDRALTSEFELARYTSSVQLGMNSELQNKVEAAFSWLTLVDRVALVPRAGMVTFDLASHLQAGWWTQYWDSTQRVLSVAIRTMSADVLKPKELSQPAHKTGWLSRFQVAKLDPTLALQVCVRSLDLVERTMTSYVAIDEVKRIVGFHLEVFSRLVIRIRDSGTASFFAGRVITLFHAPRISELAELWGTFSAALARCFEALPRREQRALVPLIIGIPESPPGKTIHPHYAHEWLNHRELWGNSNTQPESLIDIVISSELTRLIVKIKQLKDEVRKDECGRAWTRLLWLNHLGFVPNEVRAEIGAVLWDEAGASTWPHIPNHFATSTFAWPAPDGVDMNVVFCKWAASRELAKFSSKSMMSVSNSASGKEWGFPVNDALLEAWVYSMSKRPWSGEEVVAGLGSVKRWWDVEWKDVESDLPRFDDLQKAAARRLDLVDEVFANGLFANDRKVDFLDSTLSSWLNDVVAGGKTCGAQFWRFRLARSLHAANESEFVQIQDEMARHFLSAAETDASGVAARVAANWLEKGTAVAQFRPTLLLDVFCGIVAARRMPNLIWVLHLLVEIIRHQPRWITRRRFAMIELGLEKLMNELSYHDRPPGTGILDDDVPMLRLTCVRVALAFSSLKPPRDSVILDKWLAVTDGDPLPEIRCVRDRYDAVDLH